MDANVSRLVSLSRTDVTPFLPRPFPVTPAASETASVDKLSQEDFSGRKEVVEEVLSALRDADVSYVRPTGDSGIPSGALIDALIRKQPDIFSVPQRGGSGATAPCSVALHSPGLSRLREDDSGNGENEKDAFAPPRKIPRVHGRSRQPQMTDDAQQLADKLGQLISSVIPAFDTLEEGEEEESDMFDSFGNLVIQHHQNLKSVRVLLETVQKVGSVGGLHLVDKKVLRQLAGRLSKMMSNGNVDVPEGDAAESESHILAMTAVESSILMLQFMSAPNMPSEVILEEVIETIVDVAKYHLLHNVFVFCSEAYRQIYRTGPTEEGVLPSGRTTRSARAQADRPTAQTLSASGRELVGRVGVLLQFLSELFRLVHVDVGTVLPLITVALKALNVESEALTLLKIKALGVVTVAFEKYGGHRNLIMDKVFSMVLFYDPNKKAKKISRRFMVDGEGDRYIQMSTALILQMIQASATLPRSGIPPEEWERTLSPFIARYEDFWNRMLARVGIAKSEKADGQLDIKQIVEQFLADLLCILNFPEWPAASRLLLEFVVMVLTGEKGLKHKEGHVKMLCLDFLGQIAAKLCADAVNVEKEAEWVEMVAKMQGQCMDQKETDKMDQVDLLRHALLDHLSSQIGLRGESEAACRFQVCNMFAEQLGKRVHAPSEDFETAQVSGLLVEYRTILARYCPSRLTPTAAPKTERLELSTREASRLMRALVHKSQLGVGKTKAKLIVALSDMGNRSKHDASQASVRSRAIKALGTVVDSDTRVLKYAAVKNGVQAALQDDSIAVREAAVELIGRFIGNSKDLALQYFDFLCKASKDCGTSVRKRALRLLWECCIRPSNFPKAHEACFHVLQRASDPEEQIQNIVKKVFRDLWFTDNQNNGDCEGESPVKSMVLQAKNLSQFALLMYESGPMAQLPLSTTHKLVVVLKNALVENDENGVEMGKNLASTIKDCIVHSMEGKGVDATKTFPFFLALHALCTTEPSLLLPAKDNAKFIRFVQPYLQTPEDRGPQKASHPTRSSRDQILCILKILAQLLEQVDTIEGELAEELYASMATLYKTHRSWQVISMACESLCVLAMVNETVKGNLRRMAGHQQAYLKERVKIMGRGGPSVEVKSCQRLLFMLARLCRFGGHLLEEGGEAGQENGDVCMKDCLDVFLSIFSEAKQDSLKATTLAAMGMLFIARPDFVVKHTDVDLIMHQSLEESASAALKTTALENITDLLNVEEERMLTKQKESQEEQEVASIVGSGRKLTRLAKYNGEGDAIALCSGIVQRVWKRVCEMATDVGDFADGETGDPAKSPASAIRTAAVDLMQTVLRGRLVASFSAVPALVALTTDPKEEIAAQALILLKQESQKYLEIFAMHASEGVVRTFHFQNKLRKFYPGLSNGTGPAHCTRKGFARLYSSIIQPVRELRMRFLTSLLDPFQEASDVKGGGAARSNLELLLFYIAVISELPLLRGEEVCYLGFQINKIVSRRGHAVLLSLKDRVGQVKTEMKKDEMVEPAPVSGKAASTELPSMEEASTPVKGKNIPGCATPATPPSQPWNYDRADLRDVVKSSLALSMLLILKKYLKEAYFVSEERICHFSPIGERRKVEERLNVTRNEEVILNSNMLDVQPSMNQERVRAQCKIFQTLMKSYNEDFVCPYPDIISGADLVGKETPKKTKRKAAGDAQGRKRRAPGASAAVGASKKRTKAKR